MVIAGFQPSSSFRIDKQTVPEGYTLGWKRGGTNLPRNISSVGFRGRQASYTSAALWDTLH